MYHQNFVQLQGKHGIAVKFAIPKYLLTANLCLHVLQVKEFITSGEAVAIVVKEDGEELDDTTITFHKFKTPFKDWTASDCRKEWTNVMHDLGFGHISSLNMAPSSGSNGIKDTDNLEVENEDEKAPQNKKKRKIEMDGSDTDLEEGEVSLHDTDTEPEDNPGEIVLPQGEMCAAEIRRAKNIEEREKLWSEQEDHYLSMFNDI